MYSMCKIITLQINNLAATKYILDNAQRWSDIFRISSNFLFAPATEITA